MHTPAITSTPGCAELQMTAMIGLALVDIDSARPAATNALLLWCLPILRSSQFPAWRGACDNVILLNVLTTYYVL